MHSIIKSLFYIIFIIASLSIGTILLADKKSNKAIRLFGFLVLFLGLGEGFHIIPRIIEIFNENQEGIQTYIENGRVISSLSIVVVYMLLNRFWKLNYSVSNTKNTDIALYILAVVSLVVSVILRDDTGILLVLLRNIPTIAIGLIVAFNLKKNSKTISGDAFKYLWLAVLLGIVFTTGFELLKNDYPFFIILMMPKTLVYIWLVLIGHLAYKKN